MTPRAHARTTDPVSSHEAADSIDEHTLRQSQQLVLSYLRSVGRAFMHEIEDALTAPQPGRSRARIRTACSELRTLGHIEIADYGIPQGSTRRAMILTPTKREE